MKGIMTILIAFTMIILEGCDKMPINGDLDGQWQVMEIDLVDGNIEKPTQLYYCFSLHTVYLSAPGSGVGGNMTYDGTTLTLDISDAEKATDLLPWGINSIVTNFDVVALSSGRMILKSDYAVIQFRKF